MRREYELTEEQLATLLEAGKPVPCMMIGGCRPRSPQENVNAAWAALATGIGFTHMTAKPVSGKGSRFFTAEVTEQPMVETT